MTQGPRVEFEVRLGRIRSPSGARRMSQVLRRARRGAKRGGGERSASVARGGQARAAYPARTHHRRVVVQMHVQRMEGLGAKVQALHLRYIERDGTERPDGRESEGRLFDAMSDNASGEAFEARGKDDRHQFRMIVSPEDGKALSSLRDTTRDLLDQMERDLGTKLDWVASDHWDTEHPHVHVVISGRRDDGRDLVMPRDYISRGIREAAQGIVGRELGPVAEHDFRARYTRMVEQERWTALDRELGQMSNANGRVQTEQIGKRPEWRRPLLANRLRHLSTMGLADRQDGEWHINRLAKSTLTRMGDRGDRLKALHRALKSNGMSHRIDARSTAGLEYNDVAFEGRVVDRGLSGDGRGRAFLIVEDLAGRLRYTTAGTAAELDRHAIGDIVRVSPMETQAKRVDHTVAEVASQNDGIYSEGAHERFEPGVRSSFVQAHVRRLEALRRQGLVERVENGMWRIPDDWTQQVEGHLRAVAPDRPKLRTISKFSLVQQTQAQGLAWLDTVDVRDVGTGGFASQVLTAARSRRAWLVTKGWLETESDILDAKTQGKLRQLGLHSTGARLSDATGLPYSPHRRGEAISGTLVGSVEAPHGRLAHIERSKDFTLVPWRDVLDGRVGQRVSGVSGPGGIDWSLGRGRGVVR